MLKSTNLMAKIFVDYFLGGQTGPVLEHQEDGNITCPLVFSCLDLLFMT